MSKIIIIGSGIGGSGVGSLISKETNHQVTLYEQSKLIGGRCASYIKKDDQGRDWKFDVGCHIFSTGEKGPLSEILNRINKPIKWSLTKNPGPRIIMMGMDMSKGVSKKSKKTKKEDHTKKKAEKPEYSKYLESFSIEETRKYDFMPLTSFLDDYFGKGRKAMQKMMYSMQAGVMHGVGPIECSAGEYIRCAADNSRQFSMAYPYGGCGAIPEAYCSAIEEKGNKVISGIDGKVHKIVVEDGVVKGVEVGKDKEFQEADIVISNADIKASVLKLVGEKHFDSEYVKKIKDLTWGGMVCSIKLAVDKVLTDQKMLTYVGQIDMNQMRSSFMAGMMQPGAAKIDPSDLTVPEKTILFVVPLSNHDPSLAPPGCQNIHAVSPTSFDRMIHWDKKGDEKWARACINTMAEIMPDIEDHIIMQDFVSTSYLNAHFGKEGAAIGVAQSIDQIGEKRPSQISSIKGLYFSSYDVGKQAWGIGTEAAARSAIDLFNVLQKNKFSNDKILGTNPI